MVSSNGIVRCKITSGDFAPEILPDGAVNIDFQGQDHFVETAGMWDSFAALFLDRAEWPSDHGHLALSSSRGNIFVGPVSALIALTYRAGRSIWSTPMPWASTTTVRIRTFLSS